MGIAAAGCWGKEEAKEEQEEAKEEANNKQQASSGFGSLLFEESGNKLASHAPPRTLFEWSASARHGSSCADKINEDSVQFCNFTSVCSSHLQT